MGLEGFSRFVFDLLEEEWLVLAAGAEREEDEVKSFLDVEVLCALSSKSCLER